jgi:hypothetical protein
MDRVVTIRYGAWASDPYFQNNPENGLRNSYYEIQGVPHAFVDGGNSMLGSNEIKNNIEENVKNRLKIPSPYVLNVDGDMSTSSFEVTVTLKTFPPAGDKVLRITVVEQAFNWVIPPGSNGQTHYEGCLLDMVPDPSGTPVRISKIGESRTYTFNYNVSQVNFHPNSKISILAFLQNDSTKEVLQAGYFHE